MSNAPEKDRERKRWGRRLRSARLRDALVRCVRRHVDSVQAAEDLVHRLALGLLEDPPTNRIRHVVPYLCKWLRRLAAGDREGEARRAELLPERGLGGAESDGRNRAERRAVARLTVEEILGKLAFEDARIVRWAYLEGFKDRDIAERLKISRGTARARLHRALKRASAVAGRRPVEGAERPGRSPEE